MKPLENGRQAGRLAMNPPPIVSRQKWEAARKQLPGKEVDVTRARDVLAAERRRVPWLAVDKAPKFASAVETAEMM
jgi:predicted dithiol-disulfide oxidoreductase (DUF899 family)